MRIPLLSAALLLGLPSVLAACGAEIPQSAQVALTQGALSVTLTPTTATATLKAADGSSLSMASGTPLTLTAGNYTLNTVAEGYTPVSQSVEVIAKQTTALKVDLVKKTYVAPTVQVVRVTNTNGVVSAVVQVTLNDDQPLKSLQLAVDGAVMTTATPTLTSGSGTYTLTWDTTAIGRSGSALYANGPYVLQVSATTASNQTGSAVASANVQNTTRYRANLSGKSVTVGGNVIWGGSEITLNLLPDGGNYSGEVSVVWSTTKGEVVGNTLSAALPYSAANQQALDGSTPMTLTAKITADGKTTEVSTTLRVDDQAPQASGGVTVNVPGKSPGLIVPNTFYPATAKVKANFKDVGVGLDQVKLNAYLKSFVVLDGVSDLSSLPEASGYTLRFGVVSDLLGNAVTLNTTDAVAGPFALDMTAPLLKSSAAQNAVLSDKDTVVVTASDPALQDGSAGSGVAALSSDKGGTLSGNALSLSGAQLKAAGAAAGPASVSFTAVDKAGNAATFVLKVILK